MSKGINEASVSITLLLFFVITIGSSFLGTQYSIYCYIIKFLYFNFCCSVNEDKHTMYEVIVHIYTVTEFTNLARNLHIAYLKVKGYFICKKNFNTLLLNQ